MLSENIASGGEHDRDSRALTYPRTGAKRPAIRRIRAKGLRGQRAGSPSGDTYLGIGVSGLMNLNVGNIVTIVFFAYGGGTANLSAESNTVYAARAGPIY